MRLLRDTTAIFQEAIVREQKTKASKFSLALLYKRLTLLPKINPTRGNSQKRAVQPMIPKRIKIEYGGGDNLCK